MKVEMVFRCWVPAVGNAKSAAIAPTSRDPGLIALIEDVAAARDGVLVAHDDHLYVTGLSQPADALVISRQVQFGLQGFQSHRLSPVSVSIAMDVSARTATTGQPEPNPAADLQGSLLSTPNTPGRHPGPSHDLLTLLKLSKPAQILVTHDLCQQLVAIKGLPLKSFPGRFGVSEYLWTSEDQLAPLQSQPQLTLSALPAARPAMPQSNEVKEAAGQSVTADSVTDGASLREQHGGTLERWRVAWRSPRFLIVAAVALIGIAGAVVGGIRMAHVSSSPPRNPVAAGAEAQPSRDVGKAPVKVTTGDSPTGHRAGQQASPASASPPVPRAARQAHKKPGPQAPASPKQPCTLAGALSRYEKLAEQYRGRGDYANAVRIFRQIVDCDPDNAQAREGLSRALQGQEQSLQRQ